MVDSNDWGQFSSLELALSADKSFVAQEINWNSAGRQHNKSIRMTVMNVAFLHKSERYH